MRLRLILSLVMPVLVINSAAMANDSLSTTIEPTKAVLVVSGGADNDMSADLVSFLDTRDKLCSDCWKKELYRYRARYADSRFLRAMGSRWDDKTRLGMAFGSRDLRYGLWADIREINNLDGENEGYFSTISTVQNPGGGVDSFGSLNSGGEFGSANSTIVFNSDRGSGNNFGAVRSSAPLTASPGNFGGNSTQANFASNPSPRTSQGSSEFSYTEYIAGLFVARSF